jgi:hypothetical protein
MLCPAIDLGKVLPVLAAAAREPPSFSIANLSRGMPYLRVRAVTDRPSRSGPHFNSIQD